MTPYMYIASIAWIFLVSGWLARKNRRAHITLALTGIYLDVALVAYLQVTRGAVQTAMSFTLSALKQAHIGVSTVAFVLYIPVLILGTKLLKNPADGELRKIHKNVALAALIFRTLGFVFMFSMLEQFR